MKRENSAAMLRRGSVLVPMVAALLMLLLTGVALAEVFGAQRMQSVIDVQSTRAFWIGEAGLWHAGLARSDIPAPISFASGAYTAFKSGDDYAATGTLSPAARAVSQTFSSAPSALPSPLDEGASEATAVKRDSKKFNINLVSIAGHQVGVASIDLSSVQSVQPLKKFKLEGKEVWKEDAGVSLPTGNLTCNEGNAQDRTIETGESPLVEAEHVDDVALGTVDYTLVLHFVDTASSTFHFSIAW